MISPISSTPFIEYWVIACAVSALLLVDVERHDFVQRHVGDHHAGRMARGVTQQPFELEGVLEQFGMLLALGLEPRFHFERVLKRKIAALLGRGIKLDDAIGLGERQSQHAADVADRLFSLDRAEGDDLRDAIVAVFLAHVVEYFVAPLEAEIDVDIGHRAAARIEPSLEQQLVLDRIDLGYPERIGDQAAHHRAAAWSDRNPEAARIIDEVGDDQHVAGKAHLADDRQLAVRAARNKALRRIRRAARAV